MEDGMLVVIPVADRTLADACVKSILMENSAAGINKEDILIVDNTKEGLGEYFGIQVYRDKESHNIGVARAWNIGAREVVKRGLDYLVIMSQSMMFGVIKETTWTKQMSTFWGYDIIESTGHSWHLIAIHRRVFEAIGYFDENFYPGYFEQIDFHKRMQLAGFGNKGDGHWCNVWVNVLSMTVGRHSDLVLATPLLSYYKEKWGGDKHEEKYELPFGDKPLDYFPENSIPELARKYNLSNWW